MTLATQLKPQKSPTYLVLDAIRAAAQQDATTTRKANMAYLVAATGLSGRTVNALVYALEKQERVVAHTYEVPRREQIFTVLRYEPNEPRGHRDRASNRCHPAKAAKASSSPSISLAHRSFAENDAQLDVSPADIENLNPSIRRRAEICSSTVRQRSRFHHAHPANREAHRELQAVEDFELLFTSFFTAAPAVATAVESDDDAEMAVTADIAAAVVEDEVPVVGGATPRNRGGIRPGAHRGSGWCSAVRRHPGGRRAGKWNSLATRAGQAPPRQIRRPWEAHFGEFGHNAGPPKEKSPFQLRGGNGDLGTQGKGATEESADTFFRNRRVTNALLRSSSFLLRIMPITRRSVPHIIASV